MQALRPQPRPTDLERRQRGRVSILTAFPAGPDPSNTGEPWSQGAECRAQQRNGPSGDSLLDFELLSPGRLPSCPISECPASGCVRDSRVTVVPSSPLGTLISSHTHTRLEFPSLPKTEVQGSIKFLVLPHPCQGERHFLDCSFKSHSLEPARWLIRYRCLLPRQTTRCQFPKTRSAKGLAPTSCPLTSTHLL